MSNKIIQLAQADTSVVENLAASDQKMIDLNKQLVGFLDDYEKLNFSYSGQSFFNFQNIYFWILLAGLFLLALGLVLLLAELKKNAKDKQAEKVASILAEEEIEEDETEEDEEDKEQMKTIVLDKEEETGEDDVEEETEEEDAEEEDDEDREIEEEEQLKPIVLSGEKKSSSKKIKTKRKPIKIKVVKVK